MADLRTLFKSVSLFGRHPGEFFPSPLLPGWFYVAARQKKNRKIMMVRQSKHGDTISKLSSRTYYSEVSPYPEVLWHPFQTSPSYRFHSLLSYWPHPEWEPRSSTDADGRRIGKE